MFSAAWSHQSCKQLSGAPLLISYLFKRNTTKWMNQKTIGKIHLWWVRPAGDWVFDIDLVPIWYLNNWRKSGKNLEQPMSKFKPSDNVNRSVATRCCVSHSNLGQNGTRQVDRTKHMQPHQRQGLVPWPSNEGSKKATSQTSIYPKDMITLIQIEMRCGCLPPSPAPLRR